MTHLTPADIRKIAAESGITHARFCVEQEASQRGYDKCKRLFRQLDLIEDELAKQDQIESGAFI